MLEIDRLKTFSQNSTTFLIVDFCGFFRFRAQNGKIHADFCVFMLTFDDFMLTFIFLILLFSVLYLKKC